MKKKTWSKRVINAIFLVPTMFVMIFFSSGCLNNNVVHEANDTLITKVDSSLERCYKFFSDYNTDLLHNKDIIMLILLMREHFNLAFSFPTEKQFVSTFPPLTQSYLQFYDLYFLGKDKPDYDNEKAISDLYSNYHETTDALTDWSMWCKYFPLPDDYFDAVIKESDAGVYSLAYAAFQVQNITTNKCFKNKYELDSIKSVIANKLKDIAVLPVSRDYSLDQKALVMATLYYIGYGNMIKDSEIQWLLSMQKNDGGWSNHFDHETSDIRPTALAMWVLLEYKHKYQNTI